MATLNRMILVLVVVLVPIVASLDYYKILGVNREASSTQIRKAYRQKSLKYHPDKCKEAECEENFRNVAKGKKKKGEGVTKYIDCINIRGIKKGRVFLFV